MQFKLKTVQFRILMDKDNLNLLTKVNLVMALVLTHMKPPRTTKTLTTTAWQSDPY
jgi:hypothetical protein